MFKSVDFPEPEDPIIATISPSFTWQLRPFKTSNF
jgi:hypothetical protein